MSAHSDATNEHVHIRSRRGEAYNNLGGPTPFGTPDRERLLVYNERVTRTKEWNKVYVEGLPQNVMMTQRGGIPHLRETLENILD